MLNLSTGLIISDSLTRAIVTVVDEPPLTTRFPLAKFCSIVLLPFQLFDRTTTFPFHKVIAILSFVPGSPLSVIVSCNVKLDSTVTSFSGSVISVRFAFAANVAVPVVGVGLFTARDDKAFVFKRYSLTTPATVLLKNICTLPWMFLPDLLYFTPRPILIFELTSAA